MTAVRVPPWLRRGAAIVVLLLIIEYAVLPQLAGARKALETFSGVEPRYLVVGLLLEAASLLAYAMLTRSVLAREGRPSLWTLIRIDLTTLGVSHMLPGGAATASALRYRLQRSAGINASEAVSAAAIQGAGSAVVLNVILWIGLLISIPSRGGNPIYGTAAAVGTLLIAAVFIGVVLLTRGSERTVRIVRSIAHRVPGLSPDGAEQLVRTFADRLRVLGADKPLLIRATLWAAANWLLDAASLWVFLYAYGHATPLDGLLVAYGLANVLAAIPITPGGIGIIEGALVPTLVGFSATRAVALLGVVTWRLANFWLPIPISALAYLSLRTGSLRHRRLPQQRPWNDPDTIKEEITT
ncbi:lysylphosphatidylglycerol synthase transmembrane domain-containing protein [Candidatus Protofrankia californiensis]|uniref:lysylphosphatidylglycerol synthase transmembrane domain-containing protein n=1 Tax=Candidatus Protofrankia californiensis TaxID=1839754 RepID=UPI0013ED442F|nr:lysylphosphatidylglycerol synthase transmembrane domain-containing protein [Candidatus Protofrankia californiensis]